LYSKAPATTYKFFSCAVIILSVVAASCYLARAANLDMFTRAEACFSESAREMLKAGNWVVPTYYGISEFDKPILTYWLIIFAYKLLGVSIFVSRLPSILAAISSLLLLAIFTRKIYGSRAALLAMMALATSIGFSEMASSSMSDMLMCLFEFGAIVAFYLGVENDSLPSIYFFVSSICLSLAFLTKGLSAILLPAVTLIAFLVLYKRLYLLKWRHLVIGLATFIVIAVPWHVALFQLCGYQAIEWMYFHETLQRFAGSISPYNFGHPPYYMLWSFISSLLPWAIFLPIVLLGVIDDFKRKVSDKQMRCSVCMLLWILAHLLLFSLSKSNWGYYNLPCYPAACVLIGTYGVRYLTVAMNRTKWEVLVLPLVIYAITCATFLLSSLYFWPAKVTQQAQCRFSKLVAAMPASTIFVNHSDLLGQYGFSDLILFRTARLPIYRDQNELVKLFGQSTPMCAALSAFRFQQLDSCVKDRLKVVAKAKFTYVNFPGSKLVSTSDNKVDLILITN
jgi:4-amino-4-deoxy-L-arabinose transferase-like glycosyltransferase